MALSIIKHFCNLGIKNNFCVKAIVSFLMLVIVGTYRNLKGLRTNLHSDFLSFVIISAKVHWLEHLICVQLIVQYLKVSTAAPRHIGPASNRIPLIMKEVFTLWSRTCDRAVVIAHLLSRTCDRAPVIAHLLSRT